MSPSLYLLFNFFFDKFDKNQRTLLVRRAGLSREGSILLNMEIFRDGAVVLTMQTELRAQYKTKISIFEFAIMQNLYIL